MNVFVFAFVVSITIFRERFPNGTCCNKGEEGSYIHDARAHTLLEVTELLQILSNSLMHTLYIRECNITGYYI